MNKEMAYYSRSLLNRAFLLLDLPKEFDLFQCRHTIGPVFDPYADRIITVR
jgi:hypothetical protein